MPLDTLVTTGAHAGSPNTRPVAGATQASITTADRAIWTGIRAVRPYDAKARPTMLLMAYQATRPQQQGVP